MTSVVIYTADLGSFDQVWEPVRQEGVDVSYVRFGDEAAATDSLWGSYPADRHPGLLDAIGNSRLTARWYKTHPHVLFPDADLTIWVDSCIEVTSPRFARDVAGTITRGWSYGAIEHPDRDNVWDEIEAAETLAKYAGNSHREMVEEFDGVVSLQGATLWAMTILARRNEEEARVVDAWVWAETLRWSTRTVTALDQLILPFVLEATRETVGILALEPPHPSNPYEYGNLWANAWFRRHPHQKDT